MGSENQKEAVRSFWNSASCDEVYATGATDKERYQAQRRARHELEPYLREFAKFVEGRGRDVLEIGVGMGADHFEWAKSQPDSLVGIDLTTRGIGHTKKRLRLHGLASNLLVADAETMPFASNSFDLIYSWGVLHHSPDTAKAAGEVLRVLRPGGKARIMIYHKYSLVGYLLWLRYGLFAGRPLRGLSEIYDVHLESPGTKAYTAAEATRLFSGFSRLDVWVELSYGDLLQGAVGQRHGGVLLSAVKKLWPRFLIKRLFRNHGLLLLIEAVK